MDVVYFLIFTFPSVADLAKYLNYLADNQTAYEEHRAWRKGYDESVHRSTSKLLAHSWSCRICQWAAGFPTEPGTNLIKSKNEKC